MLDGAALTGRFHTRSKCAITETLDGAIVNLNIITSRFPIGTDGRNIIIANIADSQGGSPFKASSQASIVCHKN